MPRSLRICAFEVDSRSSKNLTTSFCLLGSTYFYGIFGQMHNQTENVPVNHDEFTRFSARDAKDSPDES